MAVSPTHCLGQHQMTLLHVGTTTVGHGEERGTKKARETQGSRDQIREPGRWMSITLRDTTRWRLQLKECIPQHANPSGWFPRWSRGNNAVSYTTKWNTQVFLATFPKFRECG